MNVVMRSMMRSGERKDECIGLGLNIWVRVTPLSK